jgi:microcystin degradation protein MlrC
MAYRVLIAQFMHETNTFSKLPTTLDDYRKRWLIEGEAMVPRFTAPRNEIGGYIDAVKTYGWQPVWAGAANATPSGKLTRDCWETIRDKIVNGRTQRRHARRHLPLSSRRHGERNRG